MANKIKKFFSANIREFALIIILILLSLFVNVRSGGVFITLKNLKEMLTDSSVLAILSVGMMMVIITKGIDLSIGSIMALAGMIGTTILKDNKSLSPIIIVLIAVGVGIVCGLINGFFISRIKILPIIATLAMMNAFRGITYLISGGSWRLQQDMSPGFLSVATGEFLGINNLVWIAAIVYIIGYLFLNYIRKGRQIYAVGNSEESARVSGINVKNVLLLVYILMGALAGLAGILYVSRFGASQGETATGYEMNVIAACVLGGVSITGGTGKVQGVLLGALLLGILNNALPLINVSPFWQQAIKGLIILVSVVINALIQRNIRRKALERRAAA